MQRTSLRARLSRQFALQTMLGLSLVCGAVYLVISLTLASRQDDTLVQKRATVQRLLNEGRKRSTTSRASSTCSAISWLGS